MAPQLRPCSRSDGYDPEPGPAQGARRLRPDRLHPRPTPGRIKLGNPSPFSREAGSSSSHPSPVGSVPIPSLPPPRRFIIAYRLSLRACLLASGSRGLSPPRAFRKLFSTGGRGGSGGSSRSSGVERSWQQEEACVRGRNQKNNPGCRRSPVRLRGFVGTA